MSFLFLFTVFFCFLSYSNFNSSSKYDHCYYTEFCDNSSTSLLFTHFQTLVPSSKILYYFVTQSNFEITVVLYYFKFQCFGFRNSNTPYYLLSHNIIVRPIVSCKCFYSFILLFLSGDIQLYPGPISLNQYVSSPLDVYEPISTPTAPNLCNVTLNSRSVLNKSAIINNHILETKLIYYVLQKFGLMMVNLKIRCCLLYFHPIIFFHSIMAGFIRPVVVLLLLTRNLFLILLCPLLFSPHSNALVP